MSRCVADDRGCQCVLLGVLKLIATGQASYNTKHRKGPILKNLKTKSTIVHRAGSAIGASTTSSGHLSPARLRVVQNSCLTDRYEISEDIVGEGATGAVKLVTEKHRRQTRALKTLHLKDAEDANHVDEVLNEMEVYLRLDHPNICRLLEVNVEEGKCHLIMEHCLGRELFDRLEDTGPYSELDATLAVSQMLDALQYLHSRHICHRDLKLENWVYADQTPNARLKLIDFGFSKVVCGDAPMTDFLGTAYYMAPEVIAGSYNNKCDLWSTGVITYLLLFGYPPIGDFDDTDIQILRKIKSGIPPKMNHEEWYDLSPEARCFVSSLLRRDPAMRPSAKTAAKHEWLLICSGDDSPRNLPAHVDKQVLKRMTTFASYSVIKRAACCLIAYLMSFEDTEELEAQFKAMDKDNTGTINQREFVEVLAEHLSMPEEQALALFEKLDLTGDSQLTYSEFLAAACQSRLLAHEETIKEAFRRFDCDSTGFISLDNLRNALGEQYHGMKVEDIMKQVDSDNDGVINYLEFVQALRDVGRDDLGDLTDMQVVDSWRKMDLSKLPAQHKVPRTSSVATTDCGSESSPAVSTVTSPATSTAMIIG
eukprot:CAMPEP_0176026454 /NCGR_PEP_ID=MMETSP0120_2-20121206/12959_1 /TAXON_ID=160619 /ORGANISM="Kryptoperidinium foliaceum, Strain CCMP 1326" /LENGTH=593 /DNA_ID=CAMNT_0017359651 /DNA_START=43 /DNA_END=1820 /DNA_ORIENTATION=+